MIQLTPHNERGGCRGYDTQQEREIDITRLRCEGFNHFTTYRDANSPIALSYGKSPFQATNVLLQKPWSPKPGDRGYDLLC